MNLEEVKDRNVFFDVLKGLDKDNDLNMMKTYEGIEIENTEKAYKFLSENVFNDLVKLEKHRNYLIFFHD